VDTVTVGSLKELSKVNGKCDVLKIVGVEFPTTIAFDPPFPPVVANSIALIGCRGDVIRIDAEYLDIQQSSFVEIATRSRLTKLTMSTAKYLTLMKDAYEVALWTSAVQFVNAAVLESIHITNSWVGAVFATSMKIANVTACYIGTALAMESAPMVFAKEAAITNTNWPFADVGTAMPGQRINVFEAPYRNGIPVYTPEGAETALGKTLVSVGPETILTIDEAIARVDQDNALSETLRMAAKRAKENAIARFRSHSSNLDHNS
jgi:hypothetical protein